MNNEIQTWTPEEKKLHEEAMERIQKLNEEMIKWNLKKLIKKV